LEKDFDKILEGALSVMVQSCYIHFWNTSSKNYCYSNTRAAV